MPRKRKLTKEELEKLEEESMVSLNKLYLEVFGKTFEDMISPKKQEPQPVNTTIAPEDDFVYEKVKLKTGRFVLDGNGHDEDFFFD